MSARSLRRSFATPLVVTLAVPACIVSSGTKSPPAGKTTDHRAQPQPQVNPPRTVEPGDPTSETPRDPQPGDTTVQAPPGDVELRSWHVVRSASDKACHATLNITCPPQATCNPPRPSKVECPPGLTMPQGLTIEETYPGQCGVFYPDPPCPAGATCNPPPPVSVACPTR